jgi:hypothetical protein
MAKKHSGKRERSALETSSVCEFRQPDTPHISHAASPWQTGGMELASFRRFPPTVPPPPQMKVNDPSLLAESDRTSN